MTKPCSMFKEFPMIKSALTVPLAEIETARIGPLAGVVPLPLSTAPDPTVMDPDRFLIRFRDSTETDSGEERAYLTRSSSGHTLNWHSQHLTSISSVFTQSLKTLQRPADMTPPLIVPLAAIEPAVTMPDATT